MTSLALPCGATVDTELAGVMLAFLDAERLEAPDVRRMISQWPSPGRVTIEDWVRCLDALAEHAGREALGPRLVSHLRIEHFGLLGRLLRTCETLGQALLALQRYSVLVYHGNSQRVSFVGHDVVVTWSVEYGDFTDISTEVCICIIVQAARLLAGERWRLKAADCGGGARDVNRSLAAYQDFFRCPIIQGVGFSSIRFSIDCLLLPVLNPEQKDRAHIQQQADLQRLALIPGEDGFSDRLRQAVEAAFYEGQGSLLQVASRLHLSVRSLQRRLAERRMTFAGLMDYTRADMALDLVRDNSLTLGQVAHRLGFADQCAFSHAFRRWYGINPQTFRERGF
jgi:AraC-like DNA-binding protein